eukprot:scaffold9124_cov101-Isochrysis_galbana.AAC.3
MSDADNGQRLGAILARLRAVAASTSAQQGRFWEYKLSGGALLAPHCLYVLASCLTPPKGV